MFLFTIIIKDIRETKKHQDQETNISDASNMNRSITKQSIA